MANTEREEIVEEDVACSPATLLGVCNANGMTCLATVFGVDRRYDEDRVVFGLIGVGESSWMLHGSRTGGSGLQSMSERRRPAGSRNDDESRNIHFGIFSS